ncbi:hypothetical protein MTO96_037384 [Rhipicephalus appendiculatus]
MPPDPSAKYCDGCGVLVVHELSHLLSRVHRARAGSPPSAPSNPRSIGLPHLAKLLSPPCRPAPSRRSCQRSPRTLRLRRPSPLRRPPPFRAPQVDGAGPSGDETLCHDDCPPDMDLSFLE